MSSGSQPVGRSAVGGADRNDAIQGLRAIAALLVVASHAILMLVEFGGNTDPADIQLSWMLGEAGVRVFFIISGFIMMSTMSAGFGVAGTPSGFVWRRFIRIVPIYWIATLMYAARLSLGGTPPEMPDLLRSLFFIPYVNAEGIYRPVYGLGWTLNYEMFFYLLFAIALFARRAAGIAFILATLVLLVGAGTAGMLNVCSNRFCEAGRFYEKFIILYFATGILLALARESLQRRGRFRGISTQAAIMLCALIVLGYSAYVMLTPAAAPWVQTIVCTTMAGLCVFSSTSSPTVRYLPIVLALGDASYSIYLTHGFIMGTAGRLWAHFFDARGQIFFIILLVIAASVVGLMTYRWVEKPILGRLRSFGKPSSLRSRQ